MNNKLIKKINLKENIVPYLIMLCSMLLRAKYVSIISIYQNQHDSGNPFAQGHLAYIAYLINNLKLPDFDVSQVDQFWHPPLHYILSAALLKLSWFIFPSQNGNFEIAQLLPYLYITFSIYFIWKILGIVFPDNKLAQYVGLCFAAFQPSFLIRSATLNADAMSTLISIIILYVLFRHIKNPGKYDILIMLIWFVLGMWTKKSVLLAAVTVGCVYLYELIWEKKKDFFKALVAMIIAAPISLGWYIRLYVLWKIPFNFVWGLKDPTTVAGYIHDVSIWDRITDFSIKHFGYQYTFVKTNVEAVDINPITVLIKTSANDLWQWSYANDGMTKISYVILLLRLFFVIAVVIGYGWMLLDKTAQDKAMKAKTNIIVLSFLILNLISFYLFAFQNPFIHTMNFRYIEPIILCEAISISFLTRRSKPARLLIIPATLVLALALTVKIFIL